MKKILFATSLLAVAAAADAATLATGANAVTSAACTLLASDVSITLSNGNVGGYTCNTSTANIGVAVASTAGKNKIFSIGSSGGALVTHTTNVAPIAELAEANSANAARGVS